MEGNYDKKTSPNDYVFPGEGMNIMVGSLSKIEYFSLKMMCAIISTGEDINPGEMAEIAVSYAHELIKSLNHEE